MKALLIDPVERSVSDATLSSVDTDIIAAMLECDVLQPIVLNATNHMLVDGSEEVYEKYGQRFWAFNGQNDVVAGRALILGNTATGEAADTDLSRVQLEAAITFLDIEFAGYRKVPQFRLREQATTAPAPAPEAQQEQPRKGWSLWTIKSDGQGYVASLIAVDEAGNAKNTGTRLENDDLEELRTMLPKGLNRVERADTDEPALIETWFSR